ncbi:MAG: transcription termination/antitermination protein NusA [Acidobacteria bacterium]|nr:transcription termination/antitermination protein NusA [Acidobacteriota bacterium]
MTYQLLSAIEQVSREKNIEADVIITALEEAIVAASKKIFKSDENFGARFNRSSGDIEVWAIKEVAEEVSNPRRQITLEEAALYYENPEVGDTIEFTKDTSKLGRIAAHTAKQVIMQKVRDAEKDNIFQDFKGREGEVVTAIVRRFERGNVIFDLGNNVEAIMYREEQSRAERYNQNDRVRVVIVGADKSSREPQVKVSRADERLLMKLFEMEVPEIYDGTVVLKVAAREAGDRSKIAVYSTDPDVDPIGACVGMGGSRVKSVIRELKGERLDIVRYSDDIAMFACNALSPAKINRVIISDPENRRLEVIVDEDQLSLAIGKKGQNVRLASKLVGWSLEVKSEEQKRIEADEEMQRMAERAKEIEALKEAGEYVEPEIEEVAADVVSEAEIGADVVEDETPVTEEEFVETEEEEVVDEGVSLEFLDGLTDEDRRLLEIYNILYIEDILYTPREVLAEIPELADHIDRIIELAKKYASQFGE